MAVVIASELAKDMAGSPLLRGVSFKLERRDRMTIAGRNGAGKTTLLRMLSGEASVDGGELGLAQGTRVGGFGRGGRAGAAQGHAGGAPRPAPAARARRLSARLRAVGAARAARAR